MQLAESISGAPPGPEGAKQVNHELLQIVPNRPYLSAIRKADYVVTCRVMGFWMPYGNSVAPCASLEFHSKEESGVMGLQRWDSLL
jgi:hypothetical protein